MTEIEFRELALACKEAIESSHQGKADFRVRKKIFATLAEDGVTATLKLLPEQQDMLIAALGDAVYPANGSWGANGWTMLRLPDLLMDEVVGAIHMAWANVAPKKLIAEAEQSE